MFRQKYIIERLQIHYKRQNFVKLQMNAKQTLTVLKIKHVLQTNVLIHARKFYVVIGQLVKSNPTELSAFVQLECKAILWYLVLKQVAGQTLIVKTENDVNFLVKNVFLCVQLILVPKELHALLVIIKNFVLATIPFKETVILPVMNQVSWLHKILQIVLHSWKYFQACPTLNQERKQI